MAEARNTGGFNRYAHLMPEWGGKVSSGSEGAVFEQVGGIPSVIVGPESIAQAHRPNAYVELHQLGLCVDFLRDIIGYLAEQPAAASA